MNPIRERVDRFDDENYLSWLQAFPDQLEEAIQRGRELTLPDHTPRNVVVCGMGGSGIAGGLLRQYVFHGCPVPVVPHRFYRVPAWVDEDTLAVIVSYSGETEETLGAFRDARRRGATCLAITSNGTLQSEAEGDDLPVVPVPPGMPPRAAAAYLFVPLLFALAKLDLVDPPEEKALRGAREHLRDMNRELGPDSEDNPAWRQAEAIRERVPIVHGSQEITAVLAERFKNQLHENAKVFAAANEFPELNHNEIMALDFLARNPDRYIMVWLRDNGEHARVQRRFDATLRLYEDAGLEVLQIEGRGRFLLSRYLTLMLHTDYVSYYLALQRGRDPSSIDHIQALKQAL